MSIWKIGAKFNIDEGVNSYYGSVTPKTNSLFDNGINDSFSHSEEKPASVMDCITVPLKDIYKPKQLLKAYSDPSFVQSLIDDNPNIQKLLNSKGYSVEIYPQNISNISNSPKS